MKIFTLQASQKKIDELRRKADRERIMDKLKSIIYLREVLRRMEKDVGLDALTSTERNVLLAAYSLALTSNHIIESAQLRNHVLVKPVAQATYHRALRSLQHHGFLEKAGNSKAKSYICRRDLIGSQS